ncbi:Helix-turn-helix domain-containing protein [Cryptosporangium aurantiacum]|uniref:Helix-turn-helix domain-containing protein n=1 Tax=Cryptosporangium aurantiacum TaxID=134849 RepID=A0A1M7TVT7_9ACTN|nr:Helix-turn-helix domain-containing protein [Cryptosporangium aurantiacum]
MATLERRLDALTARLTSAPAETSVPAGTFWALDGLKQRVDAEGAGAVLFTGTVGLPTGEHYDWQYGTPVEGLFGADWSAWADRLAALGHPVRLRLLHRILGGVRTTAELAADEELGTTGQLYHHLRHLVSAGWLQSEARGRYAVPGDRVVPLLVILSGVRT